MVQFWNDPKIILIIIIGILVVNSLWFIYLTIRELICFYRTTTVPLEIRQYWTDDDFNRKRFFKIHSTIVELVYMVTITLIIGALELYFGLFAIFWDISKKMCSFSEPWTSVFFMCLYFIYSYMKSIPFILYAWKCIKDPKPPKKTALFIRILIHLLIYVVVLLLVSVLTYGFVAFYLMLGDLNYLVIILVPMVIVFISLGPGIFIKTKRLDDGPLRRDIENLAKTVGFPINKIRIRVTSSPDVSGNAFFCCCCCCKRIVIVDTLLINKGLSDTTKLKPEEKDKGLSNDMVVAIFAHELGHWKHGHFYKIFILSNIITIILIGLFYMCSRHGYIYEAVGFKKDVTPIMPGVIVFSTLLLPYTTITGFIFLTIIRRCETQADRFAYELGYSKELCAGLIKLNTDSATFPVSDHLYSVWHDTHPIVLERCAYLKRLKEKNNPN